MKIKNTEFEIIKKDIASLGLDAIVKPVETKAGTALGKAVGAKAKKVILVAVMKKGAKADEKIIRKACADVLCRAEKLKIRSLAFSALGCGPAGGGFSPVGSAKIMTQEVLKHARFSRRPLEKIIFCLPDEKTFRTFQQTCSGYVTHIQDTLGDGPYVTVDAIIEMKDGVILIERRNPPYGLALPGGFVDYGESLETAVRREAKEETSLQLKNLRQFHAYSDPGRDPRFHTVSTVFIATGKGNPKSGDDAKGVGVVKYGDLLKKEYAFDHKKILADYLRFRKNRT
jgi:8-oxo-dGTP diphosphatase